MAEPYFVNPLNEDVLPWKTPQNSKTGILSNPLFDPTQLLNLR
jgi:hypothetical protein